jgi:hypothetical protein
MRWLVLFGLTLIAGAGCASVNAYQVQQAAYQAKADRATEAAGVEYQDIARRYPGQPDRRKPGECGAA